MFLIPYKPLHAKVDISDKAIPIKAGVTTFQREIVTKFIEEMDVLGCAPAIEDGRICDNLSWLNASRPEFKDMYMLLKDKIDNIKTALAETNADVSGGVSVDLCIAHPGAKETKRMQTEGRCVVALLPVTCYDTTFFFKSGVKNKDLGYQVPRTGAFGHPATGGCAYGDETWHMLLGNTSRTATIYLKFTFYRDKEGEGKRLFKLEENPAKRIRVLDPDAI